MVDAVAGVLSGQILTHLPAAVENYGLALIESLDGMAGLRSGLRQIAAAREEWAGIPMPMEGQPLIVEPSYPQAAELMAMCLGPDALDAAEASKADEGWKMVNTWYSHRMRATVLIGRDPDGKVQWGIERAGPAQRATLEMMTLGASDAWGIEQEARAVKLLGEHLRHRQFKQYLLTGMFSEHSNRSGLHYLFRKLRPTLALTERKGRNTVHVLCALCLHPIAYYAGSWAGGMCPTDDVIAHLMMMRGDEAMFWRRANQHPPYLPQAGL